MKRETSVRSAWPKASVQRVKVFRIQRTTPMEKSKSTHRKRQREVITACVSPITHACCRIKNTRHIVREPRGDTPAAYRPDSDPALGDPEVVFMVIMEITSQKLSKAAETKPTHTAKPVRSPSLAIRSSPNGPLPPPACCLQWWIPSTRSSMLVIPSSLCCTPGAEN